jgi:GNAT superfamily N-acetyltransferase
MPPTMGDVIVGHLGPADLDEALALSSAAGWNQRLDDWRLLVGLAPDGSFAARDRGRIVGTAIGIDYGGFSWIAMMLVEPGHRGRGLGRRLLEAAMEAVPDDRPVRLDATPMGRPLYLSFGFEDESAITRFTADASRGDMPAGDGSILVRAVRRLESGELADVAAEDARVFGGRRRTVLEWALDMAPEYALATENGAAGGSRQYCFGRHGRLFDQIGPVVAAREDAARALVRAAVAVASAHGRALVVDVFDTRGSFGAWLQASGFQPQRPLFRMQRPPRRPRYDAGAGAVAGQHPTLAEFAIFGPEFA